MVKTGLGAMGDFTTYLGGKPAHRTNDLACAVCFAQGATSFASAMRGNASKAALIVGRFDDGQPVRIRVRYAPKKGRGR